MWVALESDASVATTKAVATVVIARAAVAAGRRTATGPGLEGKFVRPGPAVEPTAVEGLRGCDRYTAESSSDPAEPTLNA
jgi:hypothetical protein